MGSRSCSQPFNHKGWQDRRLGGMLDTSKGYTLPPEFADKGAVNPFNQQASFRHSNGINAAYFDGHVSYMGQTEAYTDPRPWFPGGSVWNPSQYNGATQESIDFMESISSPRQDGSVIIN